MFSNLPEHIVHHILSFLGMADIVRLSFTSKSCRESCVSISSLDFDALQYPTLRGFQDQLMNICERFLLLRNGRKLSRLCVHSQFIENRTECSRVVTMLHMAVGCDVEVLDLEFSQEEEWEMFSLPICIFHCGSLKSLTINMHCLNLKFPSALRFSNLQSLSLKSVWLVDECFGESVSCCKFLRELWLEDVYGVENLTIENSNLERFSILYSYHPELCHLNISGQKLNEINVEWRFKSPLSKSVKISAPNLRYLKWVGYITGHNCLGSLMHLERVELFLQCRDLDTTQELPNIFRSVISTKDLHLHEHGIMVKRHFLSYLLKTIILYTC